MRSGSGHSDELRQLAFASVLMDDCDDRHALTPMDCQLDYL